MQSTQELLDEARPFCDESTGEVLRHIPEDLMQRLRKAGLARGIAERASKHTETQATWFVFFTDQIKKRVLAEYYAAQRKRRSVEGTSTKERAPKQKTEPSEPPKRGLGDFRRKKNSRK